MEFFDSHCHYNDEKFDKDRDEILKSIYEEGVTRIVCAGYSLESSIFAKKISQNNDFIYSTVGISPNDIEEDSFEKIKKIEELANNSKIVAIGEIGLDYYWNKENMDIQKELFIKQIEIANRVNKPIVIHTREAVMDTIKILKENLVYKKGVFHCCPLNPELIKEGLKLGFYISFSGNVTFKNAKSERAIQEVPLDRLLIETDAPYLTPEPFRGERNDSRKVKLVAEKIALVKNMTIGDVAQITYDNTNRIFEI